MRLSRSRRIVSLQKRSCFENNAAALHALLAHSHTSQLCRVFLYAIKSVTLLKPDTTHTNNASILCCNAIASIVENTQQ